MSKLTKWLLLPLVLLWQLPAWAFSLTELEAVLQKPQAVQGQFVQQRYIRSLNKPMQTSGRFVLQQRRGLLWQVQKPIDLRLRVRQDGIAQWDNKGQRWRSSTQGNQAAQVKLFMAVLAGNTDELGKQFDLKLSGNAQKWQLNLLPKTVLMKQIFQAIVIEGDQLVRQVELREKQGDRTVMRFEQLFADKPLPADAAAALQ